MKVGDLVMTLPRSGKQTPLTREKKLQNFEVGIVLLANYDYGTKGGKFARVFWFDEQVAWAEDKTKLEVLSEGG